MSTNTRDTIITEALKGLNIIRPGNTLSETQLNRCVTALNNLVKSWQHYFIQSWPSEEGILVLSKGRTVYTLGSDKTICLQSPIQIGVTSITGTTIKVDNSDELHISDKIILLSDFTRHV